MLISTVGQLRHLGFNVVDMPRPRSESSLASLNTNHGGILAFSRSNIKLSVISINASPSTFEHLCFRAHHGPSSNVILLIYRTGPLSSLFFDELAAVLDYTATLSSPIFVTGDLNIHVERTNDIHAKKLKELMLTYGLSCKVTCPTHTLGGTLDVVFSSTDNPLTVSVTDPAISDHFLLCWKSDLTLPPLSYLSASYRPWSRLNLSNFRTRLQNSSLCNPLEWEILEIDELAELYDNTIITILNDILPLRVAKFPKRPSNQWYDEECRALKRVVRRLERYLSRCPHKPPELLFSLTDNKKRYRALLKAKRSSYWCSKLTSEQHSPRSLWQSLRSLLGQGRPPPPRSISADDFLQFFISKSSSNDDLNPDVVPPKFSRAPLDCTISNFRQISVTEVLQLLGRLPVKSSKFDPLPIPLLRLCADIIAPFVTFLFNKSLVSGTVPNIWKRAHISPILKKSVRDTLSVSSYRPISNLPLLSKICERIVFSQLQDHLKHHVLLPKFQSAYRPGYSTETAVLKVTSDALQSLDKNELCLMLFLDLSAAFDLVDHSILSQRLTITNGVQGTVISWLESFLSNRTMSVSHYSASKTASVTRGVPQGSVLGPLLFSLFTADIQAIVMRHDLKIHIFADDILVYGSTTTKDLPSFTSRISLCFDDIKSWLTSNRLKLNTEKTKFLWCQSPRRRQQISCPLAIDNFSLLPDSSVKYLGVILDYHLSFHTNVSETTRSCFAALRRIRSIRGSLTRPLLTTLVNALVLSRLNYCISIHAGLPNTTIWRLQRILHASARLIYGKAPFDHVTPLLNELNWLSVRERIDTRLGILAYMCHNSSAPSYLQDELVKSATFIGRQHLRSAARGFFVEPFSRHSTFGGRSFGVVASKLWNRLPPSVTSADNVSHFKSLLKSHLKSCE